MACAYCNRYRAKTTVKIMVITLCALGLAILILTFVFFPLIFKYSLGLQRLLIFTNVNLPTDPKYFEKYESKGLENIYVQVRDGKPPIRLGVWHIFPQTNTSDNATAEVFDGTSIWGNDTLSNASIIIYFHGAGEARSYPFDMYKVLRRFFHVIAFDYRSYADSSRGELYEEDVVDDCVQLYKWVKMNTNSTIYVWGHSLGSALATYTIAKLGKENIIPEGLVLESAFTSMREELPVHKYGKIFSWLPWFEVTVLDPLEENGFVFKTSKHILNVDCPIMMLHADDDSIVPCFLGKKLYQIASTSRNESQGRAIFHEFSADLRYNHFFIYEDPHLPEYIEEFIEVCSEFRPRE